MTEIKDLMLRCARAAKIVTSDCAEVDFATVAHMRDIFAMASSIGSVDTSSVTEEDICALESMPRIRTREDKVVGDAATSVNMAGLSPNNGYCGYFKIIKILPE